MPNIAAVLKDEIRRLTKREIKVATSKTKKSVVQYRRDIAELKRLIAQQTKQIAALKKLQGKLAEQPLEEAEETLRFSARSVAAQRKRLKLSALHYAKLVGVSQKTIYDWEAGKTRPRKAQLAALVAVRGIGKREAVKKLKEKTTRKKRKGG